MPLTLPVTLARRIPARLRVGRLVAGCALVGLVAAFTAVAADGVIEINQACAVNTGCFPGDAPGFPVEITSAAPSRSFRLTSDLVVPTPSDSGITIVVNDVSIDLGGFGILGATCVGSRSNCRPIAAAGRGIDGFGGLFSPFLSGLTVRDGRVVGMGGDGVRGALSARVENVEARWNGGIGIVAEGDARIANSIAVENGSSGVLVGAESIVERVVAEGNGGNGFDLFGSGGVFTPSGSILRDCVAGQNDAAGALVSKGTVVRDCNFFSNSGPGLTLFGGGGRVSGNSVSDNGGDGIDCGDGCSIERNTVVDNGDAAGEDGIACANGCRVTGNTVRGNFDAGLSLSAESGYSSNILSNNGGSAVSGGSNLGGNLCDGSPCP